jgi:hypothetical protein
MATQSRQKSKRVKEDVFYVLAIDCSNWDFTFGIHDQRLPFGKGNVYDDHRHLCVQGELTRPQSMVGRKVSLTFIPTQNLREESKRYQTKPESLGEIHLSGRTTDLDASLPMPEDVLPSLLPSLLAERLRFILLTGTDFYRRSASIRSYSFYQAIGDDDLLAEEPLRPRRSAKAK